MNEDEAWAQFMTRSLTMAGSCCSHKTMKGPAWPRLISTAGLYLGFAAYAAQTESKVIHQANIEAREDGYDVRRYTAHARYNLSGDGRWTVFYTAKPNKKGEVAVGDGFSVHLDRAGNTILDPGR